MTDYYSFFHLKQINFREAIEMFAVVCLFHKIFMESETFE